MFDAEIAAKLLNRAMSGATGESSARYLDLLREGQLDFSHRMARLSVDDSSSEVPLEIELLTFSDGSQALRIRTGRAHGIWSAWVSTTRVGSAHALPIDDEEFWPNSVRKLSLSDCH
jgi:hypothetical protein